MSFLEFHFDRALRPQELNHGRGATTGTPPREGFSHDNSEWLFPFDQHQEGDGLGEQFLFLHIIHRADVGDVLAVNQRLNLGIEKGLPSGFNVAGND